MPRGRRGRDGNARGTFNRHTGNYRIGGLEVKFDPDLELASNDDPTPPFPEYNPGNPSPLTEKEKIEIAHFRSIRAAIHEGPYYSVLGDNVRVEKAGRTAAAANIDPFEGMQTWSQRYTKKRRTLPRLNARPHVLKFFPKELWSTLDPKAGLTNGASTQSEVRRAKLARIKLEEGATQVEGRAPMDREEAEDGMRDVHNDEEDPLEDMVVDDEFEEDDDEGGDYNAEGYFDDGGDDAGDFGGDDGDGGDYF